MSLPLSSALSYITNTYDSLLGNFPILAWFGIEVTTIDTLAVLRLCLILRQIRQAIRASHVGKPRPSSFVKDAITTLVVVYGGEAAAGEFPVALQTCRGLGSETNLLISRYSSLASFNAFFHDLAQISVIVHIWTAHSRIPPHNTLVLIRDRRTSHISGCPDTFIPPDNTSSTNGDTPPR